MVFVVPVRAKKLNDGMKLNLVSGEGSLRDRPLDGVCVRPMPPAGTAVWGRCSVGAGFGAAGRWERERAARC